MTYARTPGPLDNQRTHRRDDSMRDGVQSAAPPRAVDVYAPCIDLRPHADHFLGGRLVSGPTQARYLPGLGHAMASPLMTNVLNKGDRGDQVNQLQQFLNGRIVPTPGLAGTSVFDEPTYEAVLAFQKASGLTANGKVEAKTWFSLMYADKVQVPPPAAGKMMPPQAKLGSIHTVGPWLLSEKFQSVLLRTGAWLPADLRFAFEQLCAPARRKSLANVLSSWAVSEANGGGEAIEFGLFSSRIGQMGLSAIDVIGDLNDCLVCTANATREMHLDHAANLLARVVSRLGVNLFAALIDRVQVKEEKAMRAEVGSPAAAMSAAKLSSLKPQSSTSDESKVRPGSPKTSANAGPAPPTKKPLTPKAAALAAARAAATPFSEIC
jgi:hypothetical protein